MPETTSAVPRENPTWVLSGKGFDSLSLVNRPIPEPGPDQVLARREVCTICFSSVKEILQAHDHPRLRHIDFKTNPVVLGDEAFLVIEKVGANLRGRFGEGRGYAVVPDYGDGISAFGYNQDGGLTRFGILEGKALDYLIPADATAVERVGMYAVSLSEPLGCHEKSCTLAYRDSVKPGGSCLVIGDDADAALAADADFSPALLVAAGAGPRVKAFLDGAAASRGFELVFTDDGEPAELRARWAPGGWDDIIVASARPDVLRRAAREFFATLARGGVLAIVGPVEKGTLIELELGTYHYDDTLVVGTTTADVSAAYAANTAFGLKEGSTVVYLGAGGPMGQTGILWAAALGEKAPARVVAVDIRDDRLEVLKTLAPYMPRQTALEIHNGAREDVSDFLSPASVDYLVVLAGVPELIAAYMPFMADGGIVNLFAGLRNKYASIDAYDICARRIRLVGHSGDDIPSQGRCLEKILSGRIVTDPVVAALGGMDAAADALAATRDGKYPGKICIYPGARHPLVPVSALTGGAPWSPAFEREFIGENPW